MGFLWRWPVKLILLIFSSPALTFVWLIAFCLMYINGYQYWLIVGIGSLFALYLVQHISRSILNNWSVKAPKRPKTKKLKKRRDKQASFIPPATTPPMRQNVKPVMANIAVPKLTRTNTRLRKIMQNLPDQIKYFLALSEQHHSNQ